MRLIATLSYEGQGPHLLAAHTTHVEDKHNVLVGGVFTLVCDALVWLFDYTSNKWASTNVFLKAFETQTGEVRYVQLQWQWSVAGLRNSQVVSFNKLYRLRHNSTFFATLLGLIRFLSGNLHFRLNTFPPHSPAVHFFL